MGNNRPPHRNRSGTGHGRPARAARPTSAEGWPAFLDDLTCTAAALLDSEGHLLRANRAFCDIAAIGESPLPGQPVAWLAAQIDFAALATGVPASPQGPVFNGQLRLDTAAAESPGDLQARVYRSAANLLLLVEPQVPGLRLHDAELAETQRALKRSHEQLRTLSLTDSLTGLANRRGLEERLELEVARIQRGGQRLCVARMDIDHFTEVNERHGHEAGDAVLKDAAELLGENLRAVDLAARYGGEEFCLVLIDSRLDKAVLAMERLRKLIAARPIPPLDKPVTASFGVAAARVDESPEELLRRADEALRKAKQAGRNRVCVAD